MDFEESRIQKLQRALYSRDEKLVPKDERRQIENDRPTAEENWGERSFEFTDSTQTVTKRSNSFFNRFLLASSIFFIIALGIAAFIFFGGFNMISSNNVDIVVTGPSTVGSGDELDASLDITNTNTADLQNAVLTIVYPAGTQSVDGATLSRDKVTMGTILKGAHKTYSLRAMLFGEKSSVKTIQVSLAYSLTGSNGTFSKDKSYDVTIGSSPLLLDVAYPTDVNSGQDVPLTITVTSNAPAVVQNVLVHLEYPYGFTYKRSDIPSIPGDTTTWNLGDIKGGDKKVLHVVGTLLGEDSEQRTVTVSIGTPDSLGSHTFTTALASNQATIGIHKSFFNLSVKAGDSGSGVGVAGSAVPVAITYGNALPDKIANTQVAVTLSGNVYNQNIVSPSDGYFRSDNNMIVWDKNIRSNLAVIVPGDSGGVNFSLGPIPDSVLRTTKNPHIDISVALSGDRVGAQSGAVSSESDITLRFNSLLSLSSKTERVGDGLSNTGPIPPKVNTPSTYTVVWSLSNTSNDVSGVSLRTTLPLNVTWVGQTSPGGESVTYDSSTRTVVWNVGTVSLGSGVNFSPRSAAFVVSFLPSITDKGSVGNVTGPVTGSGVDAYTGSTLPISGEPATTRFTGAGYTAGSEIVVQ